MNYEQRFKDAVAQIRAEGDAMMAELVAALGEAFRRSALREAG
jgi:hypothetical protein